MEYDIREGVEVKIQSILYDDDAYIGIDDDDRDYSEWLSVYDCDGDFITVRKRSVDHLIKALEKAKELGWC